MTMKTDDGPVSSLPVTRDNARSTTVPSQAATTPSVAFERRLAHPAKHDGAFHRVRAKAAADATVTARILQCFVRNGQTPSLFLATLDEHGELSIEAWLRQGEIVPCALNRIVANIRAVVGVVSAEMKTEPGAAS